MTAHNSQKAKKESKTQGKEKKKQKQSKAGPNPDLSQLSLFLSSSLQQHYNSATIKPLTSSFDGKEKFVYLLREVEELEVAEEVGAVAVVVLEDLEYEGLGKVEVEVGNGGVDGVPSVGVSVTVSLKI
ncbi:hypothetical protein LWI29_004813 [Acer saccharum]|uniref:Uncharacterized protein n=1 Tax=Acer saccharum TaxID=4024 RepID=A0AA39VYE6_ACESA|nr:hypothetical protein LWI29_004813 [Acer saccharum]